MLTLLSPAKSLDFESKLPFSIIGSELLFKSKAEQINKKLRKLSSPDLMDLMHISEKLADLNLERNRSFDLDDETLELRPAIYAFDGDVYKGLGAYEWTQQDVNEAQNRILILSGLYGLLRPLDLMLPYRLEMGTKLKVGRAENLYSFWKDTLTDQINQQLAVNKMDVLLNLASKEYSKAVDFKQIKGHVVDVDFKELRNGNLKVISFNAKKARGSMARLIVQKGISDVDGLKNLKPEGYAFSSALSNENKLLFVKK